MQSCYNKDAKVKLITAAESAAWTCKKRKKRKEKKKIEYVKKIEIGASLEKRNSITC